MSCEQAEKIQAYHDGELSPPQRLEVESHLQSCPECRELLQELKNLSQMFATVRFADMRPQAMGKLHGAWWAAQARRDRGVRRLAAVLTAAAAIVLVLTPLLTPHHPPKTVTEDTPAGAWELVALNPSMESREDSGSQLVQVAQFMATDLSQDQAR